MLLNNNLIDFVQAFCKTILNIEIVDKINFYVLYSLPRSKYQQDPKTTVLLCSQVFKNFPPKSVRKHINSPA